MSTLVAYNFFDYNIIACQSRFITLDGILSSTLLFVVVLEVIMLITSDLNPYIYQEKAFISCSNIVFVHTD